MPIFEIRLCLHCGLRYPLPRQNSFGTRCPYCLGETKSILQRDSASEAPRRMSPRGGAQHQAVLLDNVRSAWNVGSIFRSADGFGFSHLYLCGITPTPQQDAVKKTSLGAEDSVSWSHHQDALKLAGKLKHEGWQIFALEDDPRALPLAAWQGDAPRVLILGSETCGVDPELLDLCGAILYIPMRGVKHSYNVANAFSIAAYALTQ